MKMFHSCDAPVEMAFYSSNVDSIKVCCYCGSSENKLNEANDDEEDLSRRHRAVNIPVCKYCRLAGREGRSLLPVKRRDQYEPTELEDVE